MKAQLSYTATHPSLPSISSNKGAIAAALLKVGVALLLAYNLGVALNHIDIGADAWSPVSAPVSYSVFTA